MGKLIGRDLQEGLDILGSVIPQVRAANTIIKAIDGDDAARQELPDHARLLLVANGINLLRDDPHQTFADARKELAGVIGCDQARLREVLSLISSQVYEVARDLG